MAQPGRRRRTALTAPVPTSARRVPLVRALSKLGVCSRREAYHLVREGRVHVDARPVLNPAVLVRPGRTRITVDGTSPTAPPWRTVLLHKPSGVVTTTRDPQGRPTVFDLLGDELRGLRTVGRLDAASTGLLLLTSDSHLANWLTEPRHAIPRVYVVTVRGRVEDVTVARLRAGILDGGEHLSASSVTVRKVSGKESILVVELREGRNREIRRLFGACGHEVTRLLRVAFGPLTLGGLAPGRWREVEAAEIAAAFGASSLSSPAARQGVTSLPRRRVGNGVV